MAPSEEIVENLCYKGCRGRRSYGSPSGRAGMLSYIHSPLWSTAWFSGKPPWDVQLSFPLLFCVLTTSGDTYFVFWFFFSGCGHVGCAVNTHKLGLVTEPEYTHTALASSPVLLFVCSEHSVNPRALFRFFTGYQI